MWLSTVSTADSILPFLFMDSACPNIQQCRGCHSVTLTSCGYVTLKRIYLDYKSTIYTVYNNYNNIYYRFKIHFRFITTWVLFLLAIVFISYDNMLLTTVIIEIWGYGYNRIQQ